MAKVDRGQDGEQSGRWSQTQERRTQEWRRVDQKPGKRHRGERRIQHREAQRGSSRHQRGRKVPQSRMDRMVVRREEEQA